ncbi:MAG: hypothetical protein AAB152_14565 [Candidatus Coatesbacteria bacterium]
MGPEFPLAPPVAGLPAPLGLLLVLKGVGFFLHVAAMHLVYAGIPVAIAAALLGGEHGRRLAARLGGALPVAVAVAVNLGIVPLLFLQVVFAPVAYPATILVAWPWFSIVPLLLVAYAGVYAFAMLPSAGWPGRLRLVAGAAAAGLVLAVGFIFANGFSLMANGGRMLAIFDGTARFGAVGGLALNLGDPTLVPRWLMMLGLGVTTTAAYLLFDAQVLAARESEGYRVWARRWAFRIHTLGLALFGAMGLWYIFGALSADVRGAVFAMPLPHGLAMLSALLPVVAWGLAWKASRRAGGADLVVAVQLAALAANVASRQWVQSREIASVFDPASLPLKVQSGPLAVFLVLVILGLALVGWMVRAGMLAVRGEARP